MQSSQRTMVRGPTFIRLLARLTDVETPPSSQSLSDRLSQWLEWTHAIALSTALDGAPSAPAENVPVLGGAQEECTRARASLVNAITGARELVLSGDREVGRGVGVDETTDYTLFRQRYLALQRSMQATTGKLRGRLRDMLAVESPALARLAEVDAVMELALSPREQTLLGAVPAVLGGHFDRLRHREQAGSGAWMDVFRKDMRSVLLAELDVRFQPVDGLLAALRAS
ncbi:hypothetical protein J2T07_001289 [Luteibacter jiangsuensis]|uniref:DUF3348 family protein n=1 Tax=Luteibacter jiangsuensis TaxID=637577 RepID=A0ABT9SYT8_9GAMM|nr:hypothetical protein [Luteibacter jiangsuensis]